MRFIPLEEAQPTAPKLRFIPLEETTRPVVPSSDAEPVEAPPPVSRPKVSALPEDFQIPVEAPPSVIPPVAQEEPLLPPEASIEQFVRGRPAEATAYTPTMLQRIAELLPGDKARSLNEYIARQIARERKIPITQVYEEIGGARPIFNPEGRAPVTAGIEAAGVIAKEIPEIPAGVGTAFLRAYRAGEMPVVDESWVDKAIAAMDPMKDGKPDPNYSAFQGLGQSLGFSIASMVASITAGAGATTVTGGNPAAGVAAGMATSGTLAYRASKDEFLDRVRDKLNKQSKQLYGKPLSAEDWKAATEEFDSAATRYGLWEAIPEAVSNAIFLKAFSSPARGLSANRLAEVGNKAGALAAEQATETITALGQNAEERKAGLTNEELSIVGAFRQQFIQTLLISGTMAGGMKGKQLATDFYQNYVEPRIDPASALGRAIQADLESVGFSAAGIDQAARASLATDQSLASRARAEATIKRMRQLAVPPAEEPPAEEPGERVEPTIGEIPAPGGRAEPAIGELPPSEGVEPGLGEPAAPAAAPTAPAAPAGIGMPDVEEGEPIVSADSGSNLIQQANQWDQRNRRDRAGAWFDGGKSDDAAIAGFSEAVQNGGEALAAHGMSKESTLSGGIKNLLSLLENGLDPTRRGGRLDYAPLVTQAGSAASMVSTTAGGSAYSDGPFILVARPGQEFEGKLEGVGAILVNQAHPEIVPALRAAVQAIRPDILVEPFSNAGEVTKQLLQAPVTPAATQPPVVTTTPPVEAVTTEETQAPPPIVANSATEGVPIVYPLVSSLKLSNDVPQFKEDADQKGVVNRLTGKFDWRDFGAIQVWQRLNGDLEVISGRHRLDLAQRSGIERVPAQIYRESDGFTAQDAAILDAELNIRDEKGTVKDYVQYFKGSGITQEEAQSRGLLDNVKGTRAFAIANFGSPELVAAHSARQLSDEAAAQIALAAPQDSRLQAVGLKVRQDGKSDEAAVNAVRAVKAIAREQNTTTDMFGFDDSLIKEAVEMAKIAERKQKELANRIAVLSKVSKNPKIAEQEGIDIKDTKAVAKRVQELKELRAAWNNWETNPDLIDEIRQERGAFELTAETEEQRADREAEEEAARRAEAQAAAEAERKAKADSERGEFVLTGSDRPADVAEAYGQEPLFGAEPPAGTVMLSQDLPNNMASQVVKTSDGYASLLFDKDSNNVVNGSVTRFTGPDALAKAIKSSNEMTAKAADPAEQAWGGVKTEEMPDFKDLSPDAQQNVRDLVAQGALSKDAAREIAEDDEINRASPLRQEETIKAKVGVNKSRVAKLLGQQLYGVTSEMPRVTLKELFQNAFDATKEALEKGQIQQGNIFVVVNSTERSIEVVDNGLGMPSSVMGKEFLEIAGSKKGTARSSGGFGIAKIQFLYGNKQLEVISLRDGVLSKMTTTGDVVHAALEGRGPAPDITISRDPDEIQQAIEKYFPEGHGTSVKVVVPDSYEDSETRQTVQLPFNSVDLRYDPVLTNSPLFTNVQVQTADINNDIDRKTLFFNRWRFFDIDIGSKFPTDLYAPVTSVKFPWGNAVVYTSTKPTNTNANFNVLSNGLWQFTEQIGTNPFKPLPRSFYVDVIPKKSAGDLGYPFELNRQGFTKAAEQDINAIKKYLKVLYSQTDLAEDVKDFGTIQYINNNGTLTSPADLKPTIPASKTPTLPTIKPTDKVEIKDGRMYVNGTLLPDISEQEMKDMKIDVDALTIDQSQIDPNKILFHNNAEHETTKDSLYKMAVDKFGEDRVNKYFYGVGKTFIRLRNALVSVDPTYADMAKEGIGISLDIKYVGINIRVPFQGMFINPAYAKISDTPAQVAIAMMGTMQHEMAHFKHRNHGAEFASEMQRINALLDTHPSFDIFALKKYFIAHMKENEDIFNFFKTEIDSGNLRSIGKRFADSSYEQIGDEGVDRSVEGAGRGREGRPGVSEGAGKGAEAAGAVQKPAGVSEAAQRTRAQKGDDPVLANIADVPKKQRGPVLATQNREETIRAYQGLKTKIGALIRKLLKAEGETRVEQVLGIQEQLQVLDEYAKDLKAEIDATKPSRRTPEDFLARMTKAYADGDVSTEVFDAVRAIYDKYPQLLDGLKLGIRKSTDAGILGDFIGLARIIRLYKETEGVLDPVTVRHEVTHAMEQMMDADQRKAIIDEYVKQLKRAIEKDKDSPEAQKYFDAVLKFLANPTQENLKAATALMPSYDYYQYVNPSEYWAVNAEPLLQANLGNAWNRFKINMRRLFEGLKNIFGINNRYQVHRTMRAILQGTGQRLSKDMLIDYIQDAQSGMTLANVPNQQRRDDVDNLLNQFNRPEVPSRDTKQAEQTLLPSGSKLKQFYAGLATSNGRAADGLIGPLHRGMAAIRNKLFFSGAALEEADARRYGRMVVTPNDLATATLAVDNMLHGGGIAVEFIARGGIEYNPQTKRIQAVQAPTSMMDVYRAEKSLKDELGTKRAEGLINGYLEAKRSRSIRDEMESLGQDIQTVEADLQTADNDLQTLLQNPASTKQAINAKTKQVDQLKQKLDGLRTQLDDITQINDEKVLMDDAEIDAFIAQENDFPQLRQIMDAWTDTNRRLLGLMRQVRLISQDRYDRLVNIKDYVPWQRVMDDEGDIHGPAPSRSVTRIPKERVFKRGKVERPVEYIIDNMTNNIIRLTMNSLRQYAAGRIVSEYATRNEKGQIKTFPKEDRDKNRFPYIIDGRRTIVEIKDPLIAEAVYGSDSVDLRMNAALAAATNFMRRVITVDPFFQAAQVVKDAPTAAIVTGVKNPVALMSRVMTSFAGTVFNTDPVADILRANGIGGFQSIARTPEKRLKQKIGIATMSVPEATMALLDHIGDASDFAARMAAYKQVMKETGNEADAINRAANVINFNRLGSSRIVRQFIRYVNFANAYLQSIDTLVTALTGRGMRGRSTKAALAVAANAMIQLTGLSLLYSFLVGGDDEYQKLDDQTKARNFFIPSTITKQLGLEKGILIPMNTSAAFFFKALPELTYQAFVNSATKSDFDATRYRKAVAEAAADALLGPEPVPSAIRPIVEIAMDRSFFTEKSLTPRGMETLEKSRQFTDATSEIAKKLGEFGGLSPIEWDHLIRGTTGVAGMMVQQASNMIGEHLNTRPETPAEKLPGIGRFIAPEEGRNREALFYDLHERIRKATSTLKDLEETGEFEKAEKYEKEKESLLGLSAWSNRTEARLKKINEEIRLLSRGKEEGTARERRRTIRELQREKNERLEGIEEMRAKEAGL